ncbi:MAG: hypothetical protein Q8P18_15130 [Pseudomonadota bacterium]|nr:hypothetical protein [Pseudomonadota bacterium]
MLLTLVAYALAYSVDDLAIAAQRGMSPSALEAIARDVGPLPATEIVRLLRSGVPASLIGALSEGAFPTAEDVEAARVAGPLVFVPPPPPPVDYRGLTDRAWRMLVGKEIVVTTRAGALTGVLRQAPLSSELSNALTLEASGGTTAVELFQVVSVRRTDGTPISVVTERDYEENEHDVLPDRVMASEGAIDPTLRPLRRTGNGLLAGGAGALALGVLSMVVWQNELKGAQSAALEGDVVATSAHASAATPWLVMGSATLASAGPMIIGGFVCITLSGRPRDKGARLPTLDDLPEE